IGWTVASVDDQGVATVTLSVEDLSGQMNGQTIGVPSQAPVTILVARDGRILTADVGLGGGDVFGPAFSSSGQFVPLLPDHPVNPGDAWTKAYDQSLP